MSSKQKTTKKAPPSKKASAPAKMAPAPVKKAVPAKKAPVPVKKAVPAKKAPVPVKKAAPAKKAPVPVKKAVPAKKAPVPVKKAVPAKKISSPDKKAVLVKKIQEPLTKTVLSEKIKAPVKKDASVPVTPVADEKESVLEQPSVLLSGGKKLTKVSFFVEVDEQEDRVNKKKVSSELKGVEKPTLPMRRKASLVEESPEELYERVVQELEEENQSLYREAATQLCTKCCVNFVSPEYRVDKDLGYCEECAEILGLGHTKEARKLDYQMGLMGADSLDEDDSDDELDGKAPSPEELEDEDLDIE